jgi:hypothetical protein
MGSRRKFENVIYNDIIESFRRFQLVWGQKLRFLRIIKSSQYRNFITPKPFVVLGHAINRWKDEEVFHNSCIQLLVRFQPC